MFTTNCEIREIIEYHPHKGFYVRYKGGRKSARCWKAASEMPDGLEEEQSEIKRLYEWNREVNNESKVTDPSRSDKGDTSVITPEAGDAGPIDDEGVWEIEQVLEFDPRKGYFVHWKGYPVSARSWQKATDMPRAFRDDMKVSRMKYQLKLSASKQARLYISA